MSLFLLSEFFLCAFYFLSLPPASPRWLYPHPSLSPVAFARAALRLSRAPLPSRLNEQRRAGSSTSLLIKWPRESAPGFFNDEILLAAASRRQFSSSRRRGAARGARRGDPTAKNYEARNVAPHDRATHGIAIVNAKKFCPLREILLQQKLLHYS